MEWSDYQESVTPDQWWTRGVINAGGAETTGVELQATWRATDRLTLAANLFVADPEFTENFCNDIVNNVNLGCVLNANGEPVYTSLDFFGNEIPADIRAGMAMPNSPDRTAHVSFNYTIPNVLGGDLWLYYDFSYSSEIWNETYDIVDDDLDGLAPSWTYSTFSAGLQLPNQLDIEINVRNLFDEQGYSYVWTLEGDNADVFGDPRYQRIRALDRPRTIWLTLRKGFGGT